MKTKRTLSKTKTCLSKLTLAIFALSGAGLLNGCASKILRADRSEEILKNDEFDKAIQVETLPGGSASGQSGTYVRLPGPDPVPNAFEAPGAVVAATPAPPPGKPIAPPAKGKKGAKAATSQAAASGTVTPSASAKPSAREPSIEDSEGFAGRRPLVDPYRVGEKVTLEVSYFNVVAGDMTVEVRPFVQVNGRKSYSFIGRAISTSVFAMFYAVDDWFETYVDFETLVPYSYALHVKESKQLRETRSLFDWQKMKVFFWDKKINSEKKVEEKKQEWDLPAYSQNIFSSLYYLRNFQLRPGKKLTFKVAHENENLIVTAEVLRRERITTKAGDFNTVVIKPKIELNGVFKPVGDIFLWMTDDDRKMLVRFESKIKIGTIVGSAKSLEKGQ